MESVREYLFSVTCAALICGILCSVADEKRTGGMLTKLLCGIFLSLTVIRPLAGFPLLKLDLGGSRITQEGIRAAETGVEYARQAKIQIIKMQTEAYILEAAKHYDLYLTVEVEISEDDTPVPYAVKIQGRVSPYAKTQLTEMMERELAIPKENQRWMDTENE